MVHPHTYLFGLFHLHDLKAHFLLVIGLSSLLVILAATAGCLVTERLFGSQRNSLADGSAMITGLLLGLAYYQVVLQPGHK